MLRNIDSRRYSRSVGQQTYKRQEGDPRVQRMSDRLAAAQTKKDPVYAWKALRLATRESLLGVAQAFEPLAKAKKRKATVDLEDLVHKLLPV